MAYEHKPGSFSLFKNNKKEKETQPDYRGEGKDLDGNAIEVAAWIREPKGGGKFMSCSFKVKDAQRSQAPAAPAKVDPDEIPF